MSAILDVLPQVDPAPVVHKFGGSSVATPETIRQCAAILADESAARAYVVVSAARGVTDALLALIADAAAGRQWRRALAAQQRRQRRLIRELLSGGPAACLEAALRADCRRLRDALDAFAVLRTATPDAADAIVAHGEIWSMRLFTAVLVAHGLAAGALDARRFLRASREAEKTRIDWDRSAELFANLDIPAARFVVVPGFIARTADGATLTLGRNGSDWSATILAKLAAARSVTIWTDTEGVFDADPRIVPGARAQTFIDRKTAGELALHGARVLHPATLAPLDDGDTRVHVRSTFAPHAAGTWIGKDGGLPDAIVAADAGTVSVIGGRIDAVRAINALHHARLPTQAIRTGVNSVHVEVDECDSPRAQRILHGAVCAARESLTVAVLGTGTVGGELLRQLASRDEVRVMAVANSRTMLLDANGLAPAGVARRLARARNGNDLSRLSAFLLAHCESAPVIIDATASEATACRHGEWLAAGIHVVTANKLAAAHGWITDAQRTNAFYGDAATVGAGLPILETLRRLRAAGERILRVEGILSGSLGRILHDVAQGKPFSRALAAARRAGFTEPDPRHDLAGTDVARKLAIIASAAGIPLTSFPEPEALLASRIEDADFHEIDAVWKNRARDAERRGDVLRYTACVEASGETRIGVQAVAADDPLAQTRGADNCVRIHTEAYRDPLIIRGPGAGATVTARALLADLAAVRARACGR